MGNLSDRFATDGVDGATGPQGPVGPIGATGSIGATGPQGTTGPIGATGPQGIQGDPGNDGNDGATGPQGPQGPAGADGADGADGVGTSGDIYARGSINTSGNLSNSQGVSSVSTSGDYRVINFSTPLPNTNYQIIMGFTGSNISTPEQLPYSITVQKNTSDVRVRYTSSNDSDRPAENLDFIIVKGV